MSLQWKWTCDFSARKSHSQFAFDMHITSAFVSARVVLRVAVVFGSGPKVNDRVHHCSHTHTQTSFDDVDNNDEQKGKLSKTSK